MATALTLPQEHSVWDCRWSSPGHHLTGYSDAVQPEREWVCTHDGERRSVTNAECLACSRWKAAPAAVPVRLHLTAASLFAESAAVSTVASIDPEAVQRFATRFVLILTVLIFIATGVSVLTSPLAIPFTVSMFLCAAGIVAWAVLLPGIGKDE